MVEVLHASVVEEDEMEPRVALTVHQLVCVWSLHALVGFDRLEEDTGEDELWQALVDE